MEVLGATASAIALAQTAFSLARALNSYAGAVSDSVDDVVVIADDISDTYGNLQQLATVLEKNEKTKLLNEAAIANAARCVTKSEVLLRRLRKLFEKSGASGSADCVDSDQIDINRFRRGIWIIYKSEYELRRAELHHIKADISLIYLTYLTMASNQDDGGRQQAIDQMKLVYAKRIVLDKKLKKAQARLDQDDRLSDVESDGDFNHSHHSQRNPSKSYGKYDDEDDDDEIGDEPAAVYANIEDLHKEFELWLVRREEEKHRNAAEQEELEKRAVEAYVRKQEEATQKTQAEMQKLKDTLTQHGLPPQRIDQIVRDAYPQLITSQPSAQANPDGMKQNTMQNLQLPQRSQSRASSWFRRSSRRSDSESMSNMSQTLPDVLRDVSAPGGIAQLKAFYFQRVTVAPERYEIAKLEVAVSDYRIMSTLQSSQRSIQQASNISSFLQGFAEIPEDYRYYITKDLEYMQQNAGINWMILHIETVKSRERSRRFSKREAEAVVGVYVVLRKIVDPNDSFDQGNRTSDISTKDSYRDVALPTIRSPVARFVSMDQHKEPSKRFYIDEDPTDKHKEDGQDLSFAINYSKPSEKGPKSRRRTKFSKDIEEVELAPRRRIFGRPSYSDSSSYLSNSSRRRRRDNRFRTEIAYEPEDDGTYRPLRRTDQPVVEDRDKYHTYGDSSPEEITIHDHLNDPPRPAIAPDLAEKLARLELFESQRKLQALERENQKSAAAVNSASKYAKAEMERERLILLEMEKRAKEEPKQAEKGGSGGIHVVETDYVPKSKWQPNSLELDVGGKGRERLREEAYQVPHSSSDEVKAVPDRRERYSRRSDVRYSTRGAPDKNSRTRLSRDRPYHESAPARYNYQAGPIRRSRRDTDTIYEEAKNTRAMTADDGVQDLLSRWTNSAAVATDTPAISASTKKPTTDEEGNKTHDVTLEDANVTEERRATADRNKLSMSDTNTTATASAPTSTIKQNPRSATVEAADDHEDKGVRYINDNTDDPNVNFALQYYDTVLRAPPVMENEPFAVPETDRSGMSKSK